MKRQDVHGSKIIQIRQPPQSPPSRLIYQQLHHLHVLVSISKYYLNCLILFPATHENPSLGDFFDSAVTMQNISITTTCCASDQSPMNITCGQSMSCLARCASLGATLCPTQLCTEDPKDCHPKWPPAPAEEENSTRSKRRAIFKPSQAYNWCPRYCKWVWYYPACCLHPTCYKKQQRRCNWIYYYLGNVPVSHMYLSLFSHLSRFLLPQTRHGSQRGVDLFCPTSSHPAGSASGGSRNRRYYLSR